MARKQAIPLLFRGEMMKCYFCGKQQKSHPHIESQWMAIRIDNKVYYICPECWSNPPIRFIKNGDE